MTIVAGGTVSDVIGLIVISSDGVVGSGHLMVCRLFSGQDIDVFQSPPNGIEHNEMQFRPRPPIQILPWTLDARYTISSFINFLILIVGRRGDFIAEKNCLLCRTYDIITKITKEYRGGSMDIHVGDILIMKKPHPCGNRRFLVLRIRDGFSHSLHRMWPRSDGGTIKMRKKY